MESIKIYAPLHNNVVEKDKLSDNVSGNVFCSVSPSLEKGEESLTQALANPPLAKKENDEVIQLLRQFESNRIADNRIMEANRIADSKSLKKLINDNYQKLDTKIQKLDTKIDVKLTEFGTEFISNLDNFCSEYNSQFDKQFDKLISNLRKVKSCRSKSTRRSSSHHDSNIPSSRKNISSSLERNKNKQINSACLNSSAMHVVEQVSSNVMTPNSCVTYRYI